MTMTSPRKTVRNLERQELDNSKSYHITNIKQQSSWWLLVFIAFSIVM